MNYYKHVTHKHLDLEEPQQRPDRHDGDRPRDEGHVHEGEGELLDQGRVHQGHGDVGQAGGHAQGSFQAGGAQVRDLSLRYHHDRAGVLYWGGQGRCGDQVPCELFCKHISKNELQSFSQTSDGEENKCQSFFSTISRKIMLLLPIVSLK